MRLHQLHQLAAGMDALSACAEVDALFNMLLVQVRALFCPQAAWAWFMVEGGQLHLHPDPALTSTPTPHLQHMTMPAGGAPTIARRLRRLGYRFVRVAPLRTGSRILGAVAISSTSRERFSRLDGARLEILAQYAGTLLAMLQSHSPPGSAAVPPPERSGSNFQTEHEHLFLLTALISRITHDLNNALAAINGRVELLLNRPHDRSTMQHLSATLHATIEANRLVRQIQNLVSDRHAEVTDMVDLNQLLQDCLQITRSRWFLQFRNSQVPMEPIADLRPVPALPASAPELRIALLCLLRHAMDTFRPGSLMVRTWIEGEEPRQTVIFSLSDDVDQTLEAERAAGVRPDDGLGVLLRTAQTAESQRALQFAAQVINDLRGRLTVQQNVTGGSTIIIEMPR